MSVMQSLGRGGKHCVLPGNNANTTD